MAEIKLPVGKDPTAIAHGIPGEPGTRVQLDLFSRRAQGLAVVTRVRHQLPKPSPIIQSSQGVYHCLARVVVMRLGNFTRARRRTHRRPIFKQKIRVDPLQGTVHPSGHEVGDSGSAKAKGIGQTIRFGYAPMSQPRGHVKYISGFEQVLHAGIKTFEQIQIIVINAWSAFVTPVTQSPQTTAGALQ